MNTVGMRLVEGLHARGVEVVFGIPGVHTVEMYRGLSGNPVRHVTARHEQGCAFMADGYARATGKPGVALVITGPGLTNAITAMAQARADSIPILVISGVNRRGSLGKGWGLLHELPDQQAMIATLCPSRRIIDPSQVGDTLDWAFATMATGRPGPVHIEVPTDVMPMECPALPVPDTLPARPVAKGIDQAAKHLNAAADVVILAGGGTRGFETQLRALAEQLDAPVIQTVNARGMMHHHPLTVPASPSLSSVRELIHSAGRLLAIGTEFGWTDYDMYVVGDLPARHDMIRIDVCAEQLALIPAALTLHGDAGATMSALLPLLSAKNTDGAARAAGTRDKARAELANLDPLMPNRLSMVEVVRSALPRCLIVGDSTQAIYAANLFYDHDRPGGFLNSATGYGALGYGPGAAVGAAIGCPGAKVVCLIGDGGLQFSPGELRTAVDEHLPITFLVWNNAAYNEIADAMRAANTEVIGCHPSPLNMEPFAAACDLPYTSSLLDAEVLHWTLAQPHDGPRLIELRVTA